MHNCVIKCLFVSSCMFAFVHAVHLIPVLLHYLPLGLLEHFSSVSRYPSIVIFILYGEYQAYVGDGFGEQHVGVIYLLLRCWWILVMRLYCPPSHSSQMLFTSLCSHLLLSIPGPRQVPLPAPHCGSWIWPCVSPPAWTYLSGHGSWPARHQARHIPVGFHPPYAMQTYSTARVGEAYEYANYFYKLLWSDLVQEKCSFKVYVNPYN